MPTVGAIGRGHTVLKNVVYKIAVDAGLETELEAHLPNDPHNIPADVLVRNWLGLSPLALDFTIVSPALRYNSSDASESTLGMNRIDEAAKRKERRYQELCKRAGWDFTPIVADTYGAFRANGRAVIQKIIQRLQRKNRYQDRGKIATQVCRAVAAAAVSRAANQTLHTAEALQLGQTVVPNDEHVNLGDHMGNLPDLLQPSGNLGQHDVLVVSEDSEEDITDEEPAVRNNVLEEELL